MAGAIFGWACNIPEGLFLGTGNVMFMSPQHNGLTFSLLLISSVLFHIFEGQCLVTEARYEENATGI